jgi:CRP/FNR family transcriptional regulator, cyclic AMP receptor protein
MASSAPDLSRIRAFLASNTFLGRLPSTALDALVSKGQVKAFAKGAVVYQRGDSGDSLLFTINGRIKLANTNMGGKEIVLHYVGEGEIFGEIAAVDGRERAADAIAMEESQIFFVYTRDLLPTLTAHPQAMLEVLRALCEKIRMAATIIEDNTLEMRWRTARGLLRLARQHGRAAGADGFLRLTMSQEEFGKYLGATRANVNRQLSELKTAKLITISGTEITIIDVQGLEEIALNPPPDQRALER